MSIKNEGENTTPQSISYDLAERSFFSANKFLWLLPGAALVRLSKEPGTGLGSGPGGPHAGLSVQTMPSLASLSRGALPPVNLKGPVPISLLISFSTACVAPRQQS